MTEWFGEIKIDWDEGEYARLNEVRQERYDNENKASVAFLISPTLKEKIKRYADENGWTFSELVRNVMTVFVEKL